MRADVARLHDIVVLAQELLPNLPDRERLPTNALFNAYYDILPRIGVNADHDSRYARVLFKIGGLRGPGTLYEKFEEILSRMGIEIEFDHDDNDDDLDNDNTEEEYSQVEDLPSGLNTATASDRTPAAGEETPRRRRNSESSAWILGPGAPSPTTPRRSSFSTLGIAKSDVERSRVMLQENQPPASRTSINPSATYKKEEAHDNVGAWLNARSPRPRRRSRGRSVSTHASMRIRRRGRSSSTGRGHYSQSVDPSLPSSWGECRESKLTSLTSSFGEETHELLHDEPVAQVAENLLEIRASLVQQQSSRHLARQLLRQWKHRTLQLQEDVKVLNRVAKWHDKRSLLRSAFDQWRARYLADHTSSETQRFFAHLERKATKARSLYLLHKAFSHWSNYANEHVQRTALARRHIVRTRIFNAWKEITAVNELKVRRQVLKKFFAAWKQKYADTTSDEAAAVQRYDANLVKRVFDQWVRKLWDLKAADWSAESAKRRALFRWIIVTHNNWERRRTAEETRRLNLMWDTWKVWRDQTEIHKRQELQAEAHRRITMLRGVFGIWRREEQVIPAIVTVQSDVATRRLRDAFRIWAHRARQERQAAEVDRSRILREALTIWRLKERTKTVVSRQNCRIAAEALYKWNLQEKAKLVQQILKRRLLQSTLQAWIHKSQRSNEQILDLEEVAESFVSRKRQSSVVRSWCARMATKQQLEAAAIEFHNPRRVQGIISMWSERAQHVQELEQRSKDAAFYFATSKALKRWKASTEGVRRQKRKVAYAQVRRTAKINLARKALGTWREKAQRISSLQAQAVEVRRNKDIVHGMEIFDRWRGNAEALAGLESLWRENILKKHFTVWAERADAVLALETEAELTYEENRMSRSVKRWSLLTLQRGAHANYAADVREKNSKKNFRRIFSYWRQKALQKRPQARRVEFMDSAQRGVTQRAEAWSDFGEENEMDEWIGGLDEGGGAVSTPIPGYLSTPSKRSGRVLAVAARYSTTPRAPLSTPFEKQLRAQWSGGSAQSARKPPKRSTLGMDQGFADIPESSTSNDRGSRA